MTTQRLQERAADLLDRTHKSVLTADPYYQRARERLAAWLDGIKVSRATVAASIRALQRVA